MNKSARQVITKICIITMVLMLPVFIITTCRREPYDDGFRYITKDLAHYQSIRQKVLWEPVRSQFPERIPLDPGKVKFEAWESHWLDFSGHVQLRMKLTSEEIEKLDTDLDKRKIIKLDNMNGFYNNKWSGHYYPRYYTSDDADNLSFPEDFSFLILHDTTDSTNTTVTQRSLAGVAISKKRNEIVYWVQY